MFCSLIEWGWTLQGQDWYKLSPLDPFFFIGLIFKVNENSDYEYVSSFIHMKKCNNFWSGGVYGIQRYTSWIFKKLHIPPVKVNLEHILSCIYPLSIVYLCSFYEYNSVSNTIVVTYYDGIFLTSFLWIVDCECLMMAAGKFLWNHKALHCFFLMHIIICMGISCPGEYCRRQHYHHHHLEIFLPKNSLIWSLFKKIYQHNEWSLLVFNNY